MQQLLSKIYLTTGEPVIKGASVTTEARAIPGASATTEVQNNSAEVQNDSASDSDPVDAEAPAIILIPLEHCIFVLKFLIIQSVAITRLEVG